MKRGLLVFSFYFLLQLISVGQSPSDLLQRLSATMPIEKAYLHFDRENYVAGETIWFKAYLYSDYQPDTISTTLFAELVDAKGQVIRRCNMPILLGSASGYIDIPDSLPTGTYGVQAYSSTMLNYGVDFISKQTLSIFGKKNTANPVAGERHIQLDFFPEGGNFVEGLVNTFAFKSVDQYGAPVSSSGTIRNSKQETIATFSSFHDGMGFLEFTPISGEKYHAVLDGDASAKNYELPAITAKGIAISMIPHPQGHLFTIKQKTNDAVFQVAYMIGQMQHREVFRTEFKTAKESANGIINTQGLRSGILQVTFFNKDGKPLAERLCFVNNQEYRLNAVLKTDTVRFSSKAKNYFTLQMKDTIHGNFSVSVTDGEYESGINRAANIYSSLLLTGDLKGYVHRPAFYFSNTSDSVTTALDLVMMTNGWRRFKWNELPAMVARKPLNKDASFITIEGKVMLRDSKKAFSERPMMLMLTTADSTRSIQMLKTDRLGQFRLDSMLFFGKSSLLFSDIRGKKNMFIDVTLTSDSLFRPYYSSHSVSTWIPSFKSFAPAITMQNDYDAILKANGELLQAITVKARKKSALAELEEKYTSAMFSGDANKTIDLVNSNEAETYANIFDYLQSRVPGVQIVQDGADYEIYYRQSPMISSLGNPQMTLFLDEMQTDAGIIATVPANQVAMIKLFNNFVGVTGNGQGGALAVYTKKGADMNNVMYNAAELIRYEGYTITREFYAPNYATNENRIADNRVTLDWQPSLFINSVNPVIPIAFYNNDRTRSFKVVIEGMTEDGKLLSIEKTIVK